MGQLEEVMLKVLKEIKKGGTGDLASPNSSYLDSLKELGFIERGWETKLTSVGESQLNYLSNKYEKWGL